MKAKTTNSAKWNSIVTVISLILIIASLVSFGSAIFFGHSASQIWIDVNQNTELSLQDAYKFNVLSPAYSPVACSPGTCIGGFVDGQPQCEPVTKFNLVGIADAFANEPDVVIGPAIYLGDETLIDESFFDDAVITQSGLLRYTVSGTNGVGSCRYKFDSEECDIDPKQVFANGALGNGYPWTPCLDAVKTDLESICAQGYPNSGFVYSTERNGGFLSDTTASYLVDVTIINNTGTIPGNMLDSNNDGTPDIIDSNFSGYYDAWDLDFDWDGDVSNLEAVASQVFEGYSEDGYNHSQENIYANMQYLNLDAFESYTRLDDDANGITDSIELSLGPAGTTLLTPINWFPRSLEDSFATLDPTGTNQYSVDIALDTNSDDTNAALLQYYYAIDNPSFTGPITIYNNSNGFCEVESTICSVGLDTRDPFVDDASCKADIQALFDDVCLDTYPSLSVTFSGWSGELNSTNNQIAGTVTVS